MTKATCLQPHRKFIALILALSLAVTGFAAAPARADEDVGKFIAGVVALGILGAAINDARKDRERDAQVHHNNNYNRNHNRNRHNNDSFRHRPRPLPTPVARFDLPSRCAKIMPYYSDSRTVMPRGCLNKNYAFVKSLPGQCRVTVWNGHKNRTAYKTRCLQKRGYRLVHR